MLTLLLKYRDKKETLTQNYRRLGLVSRLRAPTGGVEKRLSKSSTDVDTLKAAAAAADKASSSGSGNPFAITSVEKAIISEAKVERDADGNIVRVLRGKDNPLNDPLNEFDGDDDDENEGGGAEEWGGIMDGGGADEDTPEVVRALIEQAQNPAPKKARHLSEREQEWLASLVAKHGDDTRAMARDAKLNPMQQTAADIGRRLKKLAA